MPCYSESPDESISRAIRSIDKLTDLLCSACQMLENNNPEAFQDDKKLRYWWKRHKEWDTRRIAQEKQKRRKQQLISTAKAKLTKEERAALELF